MQPGNGCSSALEHANRLIPFPVQPGDVMVTSRRKPILTVIEDTGPGVHDTLVAACDHHLYEQQLGIKPEVPASFLKL